MVENIIISNNGWAGFGLVVFTLFLGIFFLLAVGFVVLALRPKIIGFGRRETVYYAAILASLFGVMASLYAPYFFEFTSVKIEENGTWVLENAWSLPLVKLDTATARTVSYSVENVTWYGKPYSSYDAARIYITTDKKIYYSRANTDLGRVAQSEVLLEQKQQAGAFPKSRNTTNPFSILIRWQRVHYGCIGFFVLILVAPLVLLRKR